MFSLAFWWNEPAESQIFWDNPFLVNIMLENHIRKTARKREYKIDHDETLKPLQKLHLIQTYHILIEFFEPKWSMWATHISAKGKKAVTLIFPVLLWNKKCDASSIFIYQEFEFMDTAYKGSWKRCKRHQQIIKKIYSMHM